MAEPLDPSRPKPAAPHYLPRLWKTPPEPEEEVEVETPPGPSKKKKKTPKDETPAAKPKKKKKVVSDDGTGAVKLEETPVLDTYEARQRARWIIGGLLGAIGMIGLVVVVQTFRGGGSNEVISEDVPPPLVNMAKPAGETEARSLLEDARRAEQGGHPQAAIVLLEKVVKNYPGTPAAAEAARAIDRGRQNQPMFVAEGRPPQSTGPRPPAAKAPATAAKGKAPEPARTATPAPSPEVIPTGPTPPKVVEGPSPAAAQAPVAPSPPAPAIAIKPMPPGFREKPGSPTHPSGWPMQIVSERDGGLMVLVPAGAFLMGREDGEPAEGPAHRVSLSTYYIDQHEVTVRQFVQFLKETGRPLDAAKLIPRETADPPVPEDMPVVNVSAAQAKAYCNWAKKRLPTEAQWEFAARSGDGRISYWNGELPRKDPPKGGRSVEPVMSLPTDLSPFGAFDMGANAWEWTSEFYDSQYYQQFRNQVADPAGPKQSRSRIVQVTVKGGSKSGILTWRDGLKSETRLPYLGFRGALPVEGAPVAPATAPAPRNSPNPGLPGGVVPF